MIFNETKMHGSFDFPIQSYRMDRMHPRYEMVHHWHKNVEIMRVLKGTLYVTLNSETFVVQKGDTVFVNSETVHGAVPKDDCVYECAVFDPEIIGFLPFGTERLCECLTNGSIRIKEKIDAQCKEVREITRKLFESLNDATITARYDVIGNLCLLFSAIFKNNYYTKQTSVRENPSTQISKFKKVIHFIRSSYSQELTLEDMAQCAGMSKKYFCVFFKQYTHQTPFEYLISYRIERATHYLLTTDKSITDIAYSCGFNDLSYFIKTYKAHKGTSPGIVRREGYKIYSLKD